jgi:hypothetical protein
MATATTASHLAFASTANVMPSLLHPPSRGSYALLSCQVPPPARKLEVRERYVMGTRSRLILGVPSTSRFMERLQETNQT